MYSKKSSAEQSRMGSSNQSKKKTVEPEFVIDTVIKYQIPDTCILNLYKSSIIFDMKNDYFLFAHPYP
jgi:hypothetical protein